jgi:hypothetical protein
MFSPEGSDPVVAVALLLRLLLVALPAVLFALSTDRHRTATCSEMFGICIREVLGSNLRRLLVLLDEVFRESPQPFHASVATVHCRYDLFFRKPFHFICNFSYFCSHICRLCGSWDSIHPPPLYCNSYYMFLPNWPSWGVQVMCLRQLKFCFSIAVAAASVLCC